MAIPLHEILSSTEELYRSLPLPGRSIRVLRLNRLKRGQTDAEPLRCQLKIVHLDKRPRFDCLSYVWGSGLPGEHILKCGSCDIPIGVNLHAVLVQLRRQFGDITIWIDAVCIDQQNDEEKNRQIPLMGEVYSLAQRVYVWLGSGTEESDLAMDWIRFASNSILGHPYKNLFGLHAMWNIVSCSTSLMFARDRILLGYLKNLLRFSSSSNWLLNLYPLNYGRKANFDSILSRSWVLRAWTYQELLLATNPVIICGSKSISWDRFIRGLAAIQRWPNKYRNNWSVVTIIPYLICKSMQQSDSQSLSPQDIFGWLNLHYQWLDIRLKNRKISREPYQIPRFFAIPAGPAAFVAMLVGISVYITRYSVPAWSKILVPIIFLLVTLLWIVPFFLTAQSLEYCLKTGSTPTRTGMRAVGVLTALRTRQATQPEDRSFSLYGILGFKGAQLTPPSITKPIDVIYLDLFEDLLRHDPIYEFALLNSCYLQSTDGPSWVPNWRIVEKHDWISKLYFYHLKRFACAPYSTQGYFQISKDRRTLDIYGIQPQGAKVVWTSNEDIGDNRSSTEPESLLMKWIVKLSNEARNPILETSFLEMIFEVLEGTLVDLSDQSMRERREAFHRWYTMASKTNPAQTDLIEALNEQSASHDTIRKTEITTDVLQSSSSSSYCHELFKSLTTIRALCLLETTTGRYMGTTRHSVQKGDILTLISGVEAPIVLRPTGSGGNITESTYHAVGPALVPGFMKGEMWPWTVEKRTPVKSELTKFVLV